MTNNEEALAFWLVPAAPLHEAFSALIAALADRFGAPVFEPHVTLFAGRLDERSALRALEECAISGALELEVASVEVSEEFTKTLFVQFCSSDRATAYSASIKAAMLTESGYEFHPHLSLLYQQLPTDAKVALAESITLPCSRVVFDSLKLIVTRVPIRGREEVEGWRTLGERRLSRT